MIKLIGLNSTLYIFFSKKGNLTFQHIFNNEKHIAICYNKFEYSKNALLMKELAISLIKKPKETKTLLNKKPIRFIFSTIDKNFIIIEINNNKINIINYSAKNKLKIFNCNIEIDTIAFLSTFSDMLSSWSIFYYNNKKIT